MSQTKNRPFLKWAGGKYRLVEAINAQLPKAKTLIEPFVGAGSLFLNSDYDHYILNDINEDLINLYKLLQKKPKRLIKAANAYFSPEFNQETQFYDLREQFNNSTDTLERSVLFLYLNKHCYNGLCRYNKSGKFNVPFGRYKKPYFPETELKYFAEKSQKATFTCKSFQQVMRDAGSEAAIYCDPPYAPLVPDTQYFTAYAKQDFGPKEQKELAQVAQEINAEKGIFVLLSNHDTNFTREIYKPANRIEELSVSRLISQKTDARNKVSEIFAIFEKDKFSATARGE